jgi:hypothetical protein
MSDDERSEFVRTHLTLVVSAATAKLRSTDAAAPSVTLEGGDLGGRPARQPSAEDGERRSGDRRKGDRRKVNRGPPPTGERRR